MKREPFCNSAIFFRLGVPSHSRDHTQSSVDWPELLRVGCIPIG